MTEGALRDTRRLQAPVGCLRGTFCGGFGAGRLVPPPTAVAGTEEEPPLVLDCLELLGTGGRGPPGGGGGRDRGGGGLDVGGGGLLGLPMGGCGRCWLFIPC